MIIPFLLAAAIPLTSNADWIAPNDYPIEILTAKIAGNVGVELNVSPDGKAAKCTVLASSNNAVLDTHTCDLLLKRARFQSWRDKGHRAYRTMVRWQIMDNRPSIPAVKTARIQTIKLKPDGLLESCEEQTFGDSDEPVSSFCSDMEKQWDLEVAGNPKAVQVGQHFSALVYRMIVQENKGGEPQSYPPADGANLLDSSYAVFTFSPSGKMTDCQMVRKGERLQDADFCQTKESFPDLKPDPSRTKPAVVDFLFERWLIPR